RSCTAQITTMIFRAPYPQVEIPEVPLTPFVLKGANDRPNKPPLIEASTGRTISYSQLVESINRVAANLAKRAFGKGDVMGIVSPNTPEFAIAFHAVATLGGIVTPINPLYTAHEIWLQLKDAGARFLITGPSFLEKALEAARDANI